MIGGFQRYPYYTGSSSVFYYDHIINQWKKGPTMNHPRVNHASGLIRDKITKETFLVVTGGYGSAEKTEILPIDNLFENESNWIIGTYINM